MYGAKEWITQLNINIWRIPGPVDSIFRRIWSAESSWAAEHLWEHYLYSGDKAYPDMGFLILKDARMIN